MDDSTTAPRKKRARTTQWATHWGRLQTPGTHPTRNPQSDGRPPVPSPQTRPGVHTHAAREARYGQSWAGLGGRVARRAQDEGMPGVSLQSNALCMPGADPADATFGSRRQGYSAAARNQSESFGAWSRLAAWAGRPFCELPSCSGHAGRRAWRERSWDIGWQIWQLPLRVALRAGALWRGAGPQGGREGGRLRQRSQARRHRGTRSRASRPLAPPEIVGDGHSTPNSTRCLRSSQCRAAPGGAGPGAK